MSNDSTTTNTASYSSSNNNNETLRLSMDSDDEVNNDNEQQQVNLSATSKENNQTNSGGYSTRSKKANLVFSVSRVENQLREGQYAERLYQTASVYLASVLEYLCVEILQLAGDVTHRSNRKRITPRDIALAIKNDSELANLCADVTIPEGGVQPFIHQVLLTTNQRRRKRQVRFSQESIKNTSSKQSTKNNSVSTDTDGYASSHSSDIDDSDLQME